MPKRLWILPVIALTGISVWFGATLIHSRRLNSWSVMPLAQSGHRRAILSDLYSLMEQFHTTQGRWPNSLKELSNSFPVTTDILGSVRYANGSYTYDPTAHGDPTKILVKGPDFLFPEYHEELSKSPLLDMYRFVILGNGEITDLDMYYGADF
jgi:hypothetical protein